MSVEKLTDESRVIIEQSGFVQISNNVVEHIKDNDAFRIYSYLLSKSSNWKVAKEWTLKKCGVGQRKGKQVWSYLNRCGLISYLPIKDDTGKIIKWDVLVKIGTQFNPDIEFIESQSTGAESAPLEKNHRCKNPPSGKTTRVDFAPQLNKDINERKIKKTKERESAHTQDQNLNSQSAIAEDEEAEIIEYTQRLCDEKGLDLFDELKKFERHYHGKETTIHKFANWLERAYPKRKEAINNETVRREIQTAPQTTYKEWGPGHPSYDEQQRYRNSKVSSAA